CDGFADILIGVPYGQSPDRLTTGAVYLILGKRYQYVDVELADFQVGSPSGIVAIYGTHTADSLGLSVSAAGDVNGDGYSDFVVGALLSTKLDRGAAYVLYGTGDINTIPTTSAQLAGATGFAILGDLFTATGYSVSAAGDV